jgi:serine/threonine protein kinase
VDSTHVISGDRPECRQLLSEFDRAWLSGSPPRIEDYLARARAVGLPTPEFLEELVKIDLEYRWRDLTRIAADRSWGKDRPRLEDYVARYPELGAADRLSVPLIAEEYWVRQRYGDRPGHSEYLSRFRQHEPQLREALGRADGELTAEAVCEKNAATREPVRSSKTADPPAGRLPAAREPPCLDAAELLDALGHYQVLSAAQLAETNGEWKANGPDSRVLARTLLQRGWLTPYQVNQLLQGRGQELLLGPYLLLERLGEGGAGQVFKARHQKMGRVVALKLIRKELLADAEIVSRFYREIQVLSQLNHPNVVHAFDAGPLPPARGTPVPATHFLAMEYVEGTDLGRLVKQGGPLPALQACAYIRQAALGLQHAHQRGLVHRDIKPHNLIMSVRDGLIKVADLGLARLPRATSDEVTAALSGGQAGGTLTPQNAVLMGTADYLAPEQAVDFHSADIRADIYSLGCTLYYLLTGRPPFPAATLAEKVLRHQQAEPPDLQKLRADVPTGLVPIARRMLAKRPADRYQTPGQVADALAEVSESAGPPSSASRSYQSVADQTRILVGADPPPARASRWRGRRLLIVAGACVLLLTVVLGLFRIWGGKGKERPVENFIAQFDSERLLPTPDQLREQLDGILATSPHLEDKLREELLACWWRHYGTDRAALAGALLMRLRSPLDQLDSRRIPADQRVANLSKELVAVVNDPEAATPIGPMALSPDGSTLAIASKNNSVKLWKLAGPRPELDPRVLTGYPGPLQLLAFSPDGKRLATSSTDQKVRLWTLPGREVVEYLPEEGYRVHGLAFAPDGNTLASGGSDIQLWDVTKKPARRHGGQPVDGQHGFANLVFRDKGMMASTSTFGGATLVWDLSQGPPRRVTALDLDRGTDKGIANTLAFSPDGTRLCIAANTGTFIWKVTGKDWGQPFVKRPGAGVLATFTPDGKTVVLVYTTNAGGAGGRVVLWDPSAAETNDRKWELPEIVRGFALAADGRHVLIAGRATVYILRLDPPVRSAR